MPPTIKDDAPRPVRLAPHAAAAFSEALLRPAQVNPTLLTALQLPTRFRWID